MCRLSLKKYYTSLNFEKFDKHYLGLLPVPDLSSQVVHDHSNKRKKPF